MTSSPAAKILQPESRSAIFTKVDGKYVVVVSSGMCHLQLLERCSVRCMLAAQLATTSVTHACARFKHRLRMSTTDAAAANPLCERTFASQMADARFHVTHTLCDVHVVARMQKRVHDPMASCVTGVLQHALSLQSGASMNLFRAALRAVIRERGGVKLIHGSLLAAATRRRASFLRLFCARGRNAIAKRALLLLLPNGDWNSRRPEMYVPSQQSQVTAAEAERIMSNGLVTALAGSSFELYPRHRWCAADLAIDSSGILEVVRELGCGAYTHYLALLGHCQSKQTPDAPSVLLPLLALPSGGRQ